MVNAVYHRGYDQREPVEVRVNPDGMQVVSYPGPDASIRIQSLNSDRIVARRYRNRRIGEFFKELKLTEGRCTGIPKIRATMAQNGSPPPRFSTDEGRTYFLAELPIHPQFARVLTLGGGHDGGHDLSATELRILLAVATQPKNTSQLASELGYSGRTRNLRDALARLLQAELIAHTIPDKPRSKNQKVRITNQGRAWFERKTEVATIL